MPNAGIDRRAANGDDLTCTRTMKSTLSARPVELLVRRGVNDTKRF